MKITGVYVLDAKEFILGPFSLEEEAWESLEKTKRKLSKKACDKAQFELQFDESCFVEITDIYVKE